MFKLFTISSLVLSLLAGPVYGAMNFDDVDDTVGFGNDVNIASSDYTVAMWIRAESWDTADNEFDGLICKRDSFATMEWSFHYKNPIDGTEGLAVTWENSAASFIDFGVTVPLNEWHHIAFVRSGNDHSLYFDGVLSSGPTTDTDPIPSGTDNVTIATLASDVIGSSEFMFDGRMAEVAIWNNNLTAQEIANLASGVARMPLQIQVSNLLFYVPLDDVAEGSSGDAVAFRNLANAGNTGTGSDGANNTGFTGAGSVFTYP